MLYDIINKLYFSFKQNMAKFETVNYSENWDQRKDGLPGLYLIPKQSLVDYDVDRQPIDGGGSTQPNPPAYTQLNLQNLVPGSNLII